MTHDNLGPQPADRAWLQQFLAWNIPTTFLFALAIIALYALTRHLTFLISGMLTLVYGAILLWSRRLARADALDKAAMLMGVGLAAISVGLVVHAPSLWPLMILLNILAAVIVLPYLRPALARAYFVGTWAFSMLLLAVAEWVPILPMEIPYLPVIRLTTMGSVLCFVLLILWQYHARLSLLIGQARAANAALRIAQAGLEAEVAARTGALAASEAHARANAERYRTLVQNLSDSAVLMYDRELRYVVAEGPLLERMGLAADGLVGRPVADAWPEGHAPALERRYRQVLDGASDLHEEERGGRALEVRAVPLRDGEGAITAGMVIYQDVTERKAAERTLQDERDFAVSVMDAVGQGLLVADESGRYTYVNPAMARMIGYEQARIVGRHPYEFVFPEDRERLTRALVERRAGRTDSYELRLRHASGSAVYGLVTGTPRLRDGQFAGMIVVVTDVTERKQIEAAMAFARDEAITASRLKSEFLATMSHELRTPLNGIIGMSDLLALGELADEQRRYVALIRTCGNTLLTLISDILDFSRIEAGKLELRSERFDPRACVAAAADMAAHPAAERGLALLVKVDETVPAALVGDATRIQQVLTNLLGNAVKFTHEGSVRLTLSCHPEPGGYRLVGVVADTGIGIPRERLGAIFEPFVQGDASMTRRYGGTGLGLAICRRLVALMDGAIWVESEVGRGSRFSFTCRCDAPPALAAGSAP